MMGPDDEIKHNAPTPPYLQLVQILTARIERGDWQPGEPIPSEKQLVQRYGLAHATVRRTLTELARNGVVFAVVGRGTYVSERD